MKRLFLLLSLFLWGCGGGGDGVTPAQPLDEPPPLPELCSASIIWEAPTMTQSGLPLYSEDFDKFTIYVGGAPGRHDYDLIMVIDISDKTLTTHRIEGLLYSDSYIYMTVTYTEGLVSPLSPEWVWDCVTGKLYEG